MCAGVGPTLLQTAGAAHHLTADSYAEGVTRTSRGWLCPPRAFGQHTAKANKPGTV